MNSFRAIEMFSISFIRFSLNALSIYKQSRVLLIECLEEDDGQLDTGGARHPSDGMHAQLD